LDFLFLIKPITTWPALLYCSVFKDQLHLQAISLPAAFAILTRFVFRVNHFLFGRQRITAPQLHLRSNAGVNITRSGRGRQGEMSIEIEKMESATPPG
jgi:hypothetical protein